MHYLEVLSLKISNADIDAICHIASPFHFKPKDNEKDLLLPAINGTVNLLSSALNTPVKRIVITSTMATISHIGKGAWPGKVYNVSPRKSLMIGRRLQSCHVGRMHRQSRRTFRVYGG